jgi:intracellular sulfur oxidation DsrE/DsrF family protein
VYGPADWSLSAFNALLKKPARIKQVYDIVTIGDGRFLNNIKNSLNGLHFGFGIAADAIQIVAALHGPANLVNYDDYVWQKYRVGEWLKVEDPTTGAPAVRNVFYPSVSGSKLQYSSSDPNDEGSAYQDKSVQGLQSRGVRFLSCHTATEEQARVLVKRLNLDESPEQVVRDLQAHTVPGVLIVASMVAAVALLQTEGHYSYITV